MKKSMTWQTKTLEEICEVMNGGTPKTGVSEYWDGSHLWITPAEMGKRLSPYVSDTERKITDLGLRDSSARMLPPNSVILSSRAPIGYLVINTEAMATNQGCKGLIPSSQLQHKFLYYYLSSRVEYGSSAKSKKKGKVPVLRMGNIQDGKLDWENLAYTDDNDEIKKYLLKNNDVLFNRTNSPELVGKTAIYKNEMPAIFAGYLIRIHRNENLLDADFLNYFLNSQIAFDYGKTVVISSVNQANINGTKLMGYPIPTPLILEQRDIVNKLNGLSAETKNLESIYQQKIAALDELKKSILYKAFSGEL